MPAIAIAMISAAGLVGAVLLGLTRLIDHLDPDSTAAENLDADTFVSLARLSLYAVAGLGGVAALVVAYRRQRTGETQAEEEQAVGFADAFGRGAEQLGSESATIRLAGAYALASLADRFPGEHALHARRRQLIIDTLCGYLRLSSEEDHRVEQQIDNGGSIDYLDHQWDTVVRQTILRLIKEHLRRPSPSTGPRHRADTPSWSLNDFDLTGVIFREVLDFDGLRFSGTVSFDECTFRERVSFVETQFDRAASFRRMHAKELFDATGATFRSRCTFWDSVFHGEFAFASVTVESGASFLSSEFAQSATFRSLTSGGPVILARSLFAGPADFTKMTAMWINLQESRFKSTVDFSGSALTLRELDTAETRFDVVPTGLDFGTS